MSFDSTVASPLTGTYAGRSFVPSYDLGYEHSQEHYIALQCMVEDADEQPSSAQVPELEAVAS
jgi:hypothetical protein